MEALRKLAGFALSMALVGSALLFMVFTLDQMDGYAALVSLVAGTAAFGWLAVGPFGQAIKRMLADDPRRTPVEPSAEFYDLHDQVQALSLEMQRMRELEDRLDFAERVLTRQAEATRGSDG
ncbi:MAG TPA: hypothetical protein VFN22_10875 [Gemmatimonadales bacterium]|nr:hypothetical protein [Gemmatimonadales bacterium]